MPAASAEVLARLFRGVIGLQADHSTSDSPSVVCRVIANFGAAVAVLDEARNSVQRAVPLARVPMLVAGDQVFCEPDESGDWRVIELVERSSVLERADRRNLLRPLAANLSHLAIVSAAPPGIDTLLIDQLCLAAHLSGVDAMIVINKADRLAGDEREAADSLLAVYRSMDYPAVLVDTKTEQGLQPLIAELQQRTLVLVGASGVGKSSIVQRLLPDLDVRTGAISAATGLGSHTTSVTFWYSLQQASAIIDSPGVRQFSVEHISPEQVRAGYRDIDRLSVDCRFHNCAHHKEPGCAVQVAVADGGMARWRYDNYRKLARLAD